MKNLRELRLKAGLSQEALGDRILLSQQTINKYENDKSEPDIDTLIKLARFFNVTVDYLIGNEEAQIPQFDYTSDEKTIIEKLRHLNPTVRNAVNNFIDSLSPNRKTKRS